MALADYIERTKDILYGTGLGEAPSIRVVASDANESTSGSLVTFTVVAGDGAKIKAGHVLSAAADTDPTNAFAIYVTSVSTDAVTGVNGYMGSPVVVGSDSGDLDNAILSQQPLVTDYKIHKTIDTIFGTSLWPYIYKFATASHTPNLASGQTDMAALDMELESAWQTIGGIDTPIAGGLVLNVHATLSANGTIGVFEYEDGSTCYTTTIQKFIVGDENEATNGLIELAASGAAALCLGASVSETQMARASKDSQVRGTRDVASSLWRDFLTLRTNLSEGLSRERPSVIRVNRG